MHLGNSIICPIAGIPMLAAMGVAAFWAFKNAKKDFTKDKVLPTVALTSLVFGLQMVNFTIPATGSSGHLVGALLLAVLLGPHAGFLAICSILLVQALFFADGGLMALGCNIFNMGFLACFLVYPFVYKPLAENKYAVLGAILSSVAALQLGSIAVVAESFISGSVTAAGTFAGFMQSIHLAIGIIEGIVTAGIILAAHKTNLSKVFSYTIGGISIVLAGIISQYASTKPDGLEWSLLKMSDTFAAQTQGQIYAFSEALQAKTALLASIPSVAANISGLVLIALFAFLICYYLTDKKTKIYE